MEVVVVNVGSGCVVLNNSSSFKLRFSLISWGTKEKHEQIYFSK